MVAWQTWVVVALGAAEFAITSILGNIPDLGLVNAKWLTIVVLPTVSVLIVAAANQLKPVGGPTPPAQ